MPFDMQQLKNKIAAIKAVSYLKSPKGRGEDDDVSTIASENSQRRNTTASDSATPLGGGRRAEKRGSDPLSQSRTPARRRERLRSSFLDGDSTPLSPGDLRTMLTNTVLPERRISSRRSNVERAVMGGTWGTGNGGAEEEGGEGGTPDELSVASPNLLPAIGILERRKASVAHPPSPSGSSTTQDESSSGSSSNSSDSAKVAARAAANMHTTTSPNMKRESLARRATMEEIQHFAHLLKKSMIGEEKPTKKYDNEAVMHDEQSRMEDAEYEQCRVDRFWGFEYERTQETAGRQLMYEEDLRSRVHQEEIKLALKWEQWSDWDLQRRKAEAHHQAQLEQRRRKGYLREFYQVDSSDRILNFRWPGRSSFWGGGEEDPEDVQIRGYTLDTVKLHGYGTSGVVGGGGGGGRMLGTFHVSRKLHQLIPSSSITTSGATTTSTSAMSTTMVTGDAASRRLSIARRAEKHYAGSSSNTNANNSNGAESGGPESWSGGYGNDEHSILKGLFDSIDWRKQGWISREQFLKALRHDHRTRAWLKRTFLWSLYKARRWAVLLEMFEPDPTVRLAFADFYNFIQRCQLENGVPESQVRAPRADRHYHLHSRLNRGLARHEVGTRVEFLFQRGPIWQPGRVVCVNTDGTYDIRCDLFDSNVLLKIDPETAGTSSSTTSCNNNQVEDEEQQQEEEEEDGGEERRGKGKKQVVDELDVLDAFFDRVQRQWWGKKAAATGTTERGRVPADVLLEALCSSEHAAALADCKALTAIADFPAFSEALRYVGSDGQAPGISRAEFRSVVDALADYVALNHIQVETVSKEVGRMAGTGAGGGAEGGVEAA